MTTANASASGAASPTSFDVLVELNRLLDLTPHDSYVCPPMRRAVVATAAAEIWRLRAQLAAVRHELAAIAAAEAAHDR